MLHQVIKSKLQGMQILLEVYLSNIPPAPKCKHNLWNLLLLEAQQQMILYALPVTVATSTLQCKSKIQALNVQLQNFSPFTSL